MPYEVTRPSTASSFLWAPGVPKLITLAEKVRGTALPDLAWSCIGLILAQPEDAHTRIGLIERELMAWHRANELSQCLETIPSIGIITANALAATITDPTCFRSGRQLAAWIGLVPRQRGIGGKVRLGLTSKQRDRYLRRLLVLGASTLLRQSHGNSWVDHALLARRSARIV